MNQMFIPFSIKRIKVLSSSINETGVPPNIPIEMEFQLNSQFNLEANILIFNLKISYFMQNDTDAKTQVGDFNVQNAFNIPDLKNYIINETQINVPIDTLRILVSLSISHARALIAQLVSGTTFQEALLPVVNPTEVTDFFFPNYPPTPKNGGV